MAALGDRREHYQSQLPYRLQERGTREETRCQCQQRGPKRAGTACFFTSFFYRIEIWLSFVLSSVGKARTLTIRLFETSH